MVQPQHFFKGSDSTTGHNKEPIPNQAARPIALPLKVCSSFQVFIYSPIFWQNPAEKGLPLGAILFRRFPAFQKRVYRTTDSLLFRAATQSRTTNHGRCISATKNSKGMIPSLMSYGPTRHFSKVPVPFRVLGTVEPSEPSNRSNAGDTS